MTLKHWIFLAALFRIIASVTQVGWWHPDEWFQTVELAHHLIYGFQSGTQEVALHLRNLTWPSLLTLPLGLAHFLAGDSIALPGILVRLLTGAIDLAVIWAIAQITRNLSKTLQSVALALAVLPWFWISEGVRPSGEHLSGIAFLVSLAFFEIGLRAQAQTQRLSPWILSGFFAVATIAARYPSALLVLGLMIAILLRPMTQRSRAQWCIGALLGAVIFGFPDALVYGTPWESFYRYVDFNVLSGRSSQLFGNQTVYEYFGFYRDLFRGPLIPLGILWLVSSLIGIFRGLGTNQAWAWSLMLFWVGHAWIGHKEPRFMIPTLGLLVVAAAHGLPSLGNVWTAQFGQHPRANTWKRWGQVVFLVIFGANLIKIAQALRGDVTRAEFAAAQIPALIEQEKFSGTEVCAWITPRRLTSSELPMLERGQSRTADQLLKIAVGTLSKRDPKRVIFWEKAPVCSASGRVVLHLPDEPEAAIKSRCAKFSPGIYGLSRGSIYSCEPVILETWFKTEVRKIFVHGFSSPEQNALVPDGTFGDV